MGNKYEDLSGFEIKVKIVDVFQAGEEDIIIISMVRSNERGETGFLSKHHRVNVSLTRARHYLWIVGNKQTLDSKGNKVWNDIIADARGRKCLVDAHDIDKELAQAISQV